tara:strand:- start:288 stop:647 length:360 start_codon:yes stop_codon:yes gene_type:complete
MKYRSNCPISSALDIVGDKWSLVIIRDLLYFNKKTFKELSNSLENIATNILADRLKGLEEKGILTRNDVRNNKKTKHYKLTKKGFGLKPILYELGKWSTHYLKKEHPKMMFKKTFLEAS